MSCSTASSPIKVSFSMLTLAAVVFAVTGCTGAEAGDVVLSAEMPLHLEQHLDVATVVGSEVPADAPAVMEWRFEEPQSDWQPVLPWNPTIDPVEVTQLDDALRVTLTEGTRNPNGVPVGGIVLEVPDLNHEDLAHLVMRARTADDVRQFAVQFNRREGAGSATDFPNPFQYFSELVPIVSDGTVQTYRTRLDYFRGQPPPEEPIRQIAPWFRSNDPASIDILSLAIVPKVANYADAPIAARIEVRGRTYRESVYMHAPGRLEYSVGVPEGGRLDFGMGVLRDEAPVTFHVTVDRDGAGGESPTAVFDESYADKEAWGQRTVDLSDYAGSTVTLGLEIDAEEAGVVGLWGSPTVAGAAAPPLPNVIFYVFDGGAADFMSVYGYNRRTTPNLEKLAAEGVVFERAYSNSSWTLPSTASFMTSLHTSVTGGLLGQGNPMPAEAVTMAEHMHRAGYQTAVFTGNPNAGTLSNLQRGVDVFREDWEDFSYFGGNNHRESSTFLHEGFWEWREAYPSQPFWAHFQTTDTHEDFPTVSPFAGRFVSPVDRERWRDWEERLREAGGHGIFSEAYDSTGISRTEFFSLHQGLYDEAMAHNDYQLGRLIDRLKAEGRWENTLVIIGGDHSTRAAMDDMVVLLDSLPPRWGHPVFRPTITRVPLIFVWPAGIPGGQRFDQPVSMIDVLPTLLDLLGLPPAEIAQGQSLAPLMMGREGWEPRPVILDEFYRDTPTGELSGVIEVVDGRWGASLEINPNPDQDEEFRRPSPLLLYDLWEDPWAVRSIHEERPDLVENYSAFLEAQFQAHLDLSQFFTRSGEVELTSEQLQTLRSLGYIR